MVESASDLETLRVTAVEHDAAFQVDGVSVSYGATRALDNVGITFRAGEVHAVVGENGSGKSSLVKVLSGIVRPDRGTITTPDGEARWHKPRDAQRAGIVTVFQETLIADELSVVDNIALGEDGLLRRSRSDADARRRADAALERLGCEIPDLNRRAGDLSLSQQHQVAIARALVRPWRLLILDEPTSALDIQAREPLFAMIREGVADGRTVLYISHRMEEIEALADRVSVLRAGHLVATVAGAEASHTRLVCLMSSEGHTASAPGHRRRTLGEPRLAVSDLRLRDRSDPIQLTLRAGEAVGLAGLEGHGQGEFLRCLGGWVRPASGSVAAIGEAGDSHVITSGRGAFADGVAYATGDRKRDGIFAEMSVVDNLLLPTMHDYVRWGALRGRDYRAAGRALGERIGVRGELADSIGRLSGGNQQKAVVARWIARTPRVLLLDDPMRGIDVGAKAEIFAVVQELIEQGTAVVLLSTEVIELVDYCDRVLVFRDQNVARTLAGETLDQGHVLGAMLAMRPKENQ
jgi:ABC-type sugar transport system ATPase subunit